MTESPARQSSDVFSPLETEQTIALGGFRAVQAVFSSQGLLPDTSSDHGDEGQIASDLLTRSRQLLHRFAGYSSFSPHPSSREQTGASP
jgi:hypothetical protein